MDDVRLRLKNFCFESNVNYLKSRCLLTHGLHAV